MTPEAGSHGWPFQSKQPVGGFLSSPSHQTVPSSFLTTLVKIVFLRVEASALGFDFSLVPGATPKNPYSGLTAHSLPSGPIRIQAMSSPTVQTLYPFLRKISGGISMARLVLPQAEGNAAAMYLIWPSGYSTPKISICSASQPSFQPR
ncbi:hypothetical protein SDC9_152585 [bioreactor metagenome]|uniref:Uncharacterized protein n=1 Tax=bioreactor metagenome TaxID=1076179 RepID=A0A645ETI2_9ZZZZ